MTTDGKNEVSVSLLSIFPRFKRYQREKENFQNHLGK